jgi:hypothetical protein
MGMNCHTESNAGCSSEREDDVLHMDWIWLGKEDVNFSPYIHISVGSEFAKCGVTIISKLYYELESSTSSGEVEEGDECDPEPVPRLEEPKMPIKMLDSSFTRTVCMSMLFQGCNRKVVNYRLV